MTRRRNPGAKQLRAIRKSLTAIDRALRELAPLLREARKEKAARAAGRRAMKLSPKRRAALKLQGQYMGFMRQLSPRKKAQVKAVKGKHGVEAAIAAAKRLGRRAA